MVRDGALRASKFASKLDPAVISARITAQKDSMVLQQTVAAGLAVTMEKSVKATIEADGVLNLTVPFYLSFARELDKCNRTYTSTDAASTGGLKAQAIKAKWVAHGLASTELIKVGALFGYTLT